MASVLAWLRSPHVPGGHGSQGTASNSDALCMVSFLRSHSMSQNMMYTVQVSIKYFGYLDLLNFDCKDSSTCSIACLQGFQVVHRTSAAAIKFGKQGMTRLWVSVSQHGLNKVANMPGNVFMFHCPSCTWPCQVQQLCTYESQACCSLLVHTMFGNGSLWLM